MNIFGQPIVMAKSEPFWAGDFGRQTQMKQSRRSNQTTRLNLIGYDKNVQNFVSLLKQLRPGAIIITYDFNQLIYAVCAPPCPDLRFRPLPYRFLALTRPAP